MHKSTNYYEIKSINDTFRLVDYVPKNYIIWNIGKNMVDGYLPLCRLKTQQPFTGGREIEPDTLQAIKCDGAQIILDAIGYGPDTISEMENYIKTHNRRKDIVIQMQVAKMRNALPYMRKIKGMQQSATRH